MARRKTSKPQRTRREQILALEVQRYWPRLTRFYGLTPDLLYTLPHNVRQVYIDALPELEAQEQMNFIEAVTYPHMKKADQSRVSRRLNRMANRPEAEPVKAKTMDEAAQVLSGMGIGVEVVPAS